MSKIIDANVFSPTENDNLLFDCNTLMYVFYTFGAYTSDDIQVYRRIFTEAIANHSNIYVSSIFLSEFSNTYIQNEYRRYANTNNLRLSRFKFKTDYKPLDDYKETIQDLKNIIINQILSVAKRIDDPFVKLNLNSFFDNESSFDFNDRYYALLAQYYNLKIVTNDADFIYIPNVPIVTRNQAFFPTP